MHVGESVGDKVGLGLEVSDRTREGVASNVRAGPRLTGDGVKEGTATAGNGSGAASGVGTQAGKQSHIATSTHSGCTSLKRP